MVVEVFGTTTRYCRGLLVAGSIGVGGRAAIGWGRVAGLLYSRSIVITVGEPLLGLVDITALGKGWLGGCAGTNTVEGGGTGLAGAGITGRGAAAGDILTGLLATLLVTGDREALKSISPFTRDRVT